MGLKYGLNRHAVVHDPTSFNGRRSYQFGRLLKKLLTAAHLYRVMSFFAFVGIPRLFLVFARGFLAKFAVQFIAAQIVLLRSTITDRIESTCGSLVWTLITVP